MPNFVESGIQQNSVMWFDAEYMNKYTWRLEVEVKKNIWKTQRVSLLMKLANESKRSKAARGKVIAEGLSTGAADMFLAVAQQEDGRVIHHGLYIEFKQEKGKQTKAQAEFQKVVQHQGYLYCLVYSFDGFKALVELYLGTYK